MVKKIAPVKGVNLGGWLVLEKWMAPQIFEGTTAEDEYYLPTQLSKEVYEARIKTHRAEFISERDFAMIRSLGLNAVRIPVPYFIFGDRAPFVGCIEELDHAFDWAEHYGLKILVDLHTAPDSQNGFDNGGICGVCKFFSEPEEIAYVLNVLEKLAVRYGHRQALWGIEVLNEPVSDEMFRAWNIQRNYPPLDPKKAEGSHGYDPEQLRAFYRDAIGCIRPHLSEGTYIVIHDGFALDSWKEFMQEEICRDVIVDTHQYLMMAEAGGATGSTLQEYLHFIEQYYEKTFETISENYPLICGEYCLFNVLCGGGMIPDPGRANVSEEEKLDIYRVLDGALKKAWEKGVGYFFWSWKTLIDPTLDPSKRGWEGWDLNRCAAFGWFEKI